METKKIKPIPKYMEKRIKQYDLKSYPEQNSVRRFYAYLAENGGELVKITVAVKNHKGKWYCKQVAVHGVRSKVCFYKDMVFNYISGYSVCWFDAGISAAPKWYATYGWCVTEDKLFDPFAPVVNTEYLARYPEYKYSAAEQYTGVDILRYLRLYQKYPQQVETLTKLGFPFLAVRPTVLSKVKKDRGFLRWLVRNKDERLKNYGIPTLLRAYKTGEPLATVQRKEYRERSFRLGYGMKPLVAFFKGKALERLFRYFDEYSVPMYSYCDYFKACRHLGLDMNDTKNCFPRDFKRWHDTRIEQSEALLREERERADSERRAALEKEQADICRLFPQVAERFRGLQDITNTDYAVLIASTPSDLIREGVALSHCVGAFHYRRKFAHAETLIFFVRHANAPEVPFVTLEYSISRHCVLQCYGHNDSRPDDSVLHYINDVWLPFANSQIKKINVEGELS